MTFAAVKNALIERLTAALGPGVYTHDNVVLSAIHNHGGPGGFSHYTLYCVTTLGFDDRMKATLFVNNLFNTHYAAGLSDGFSTLGGSATNPAHVISQIRPRDSDRYFGIKLQYAFGG